MSNVQRAMVMAAGIFLSVLLISLAVVMFSSAQDMAKQAQSGFTTIQSEIAYKEYSVYDGTTVTGSQVINAIRKFQYVEPFAIQVRTRGNTSGYWYLYNATLSGNTVNMGSKKSGTVGSDLQNNAFNPSSNNYINPTAKFTSTIYTDVNQVVRAIVFEQQ